MRILVAALLFCASTTAALLSAQLPSTVRGSTVESHDGITITVEPWITAAAYKAKFPKKSPFTGGIIALHVSFRNASDESAKVDVKNIRLMLQLEDDTRQELTPLTADEVADSVLLKGTKDPTQRRNPLPMPVGKPNPTRDKNWEEFKNQVQNAGIPSPVVAAKSSLDGLLYFDLRGQPDYLQNSKLYIPNITLMSSNRPLLYFDIDLGHSAQGN